MTTFRTYAFADFLPELETKGVRHGQGHVAVRIKFADLRRVGAYLRRG